MVTHRRRLGVFLAVVVAMGAADGPAFDAASVKANTSNATTVGWRVEPGRFTATNVTLTQMISTAYGAPEQPLADFQMRGGPSWLGSARFDVTATAPGATQAEMQPMLRRLIEDRFALRSHVETHDGPTYALRLVRSDGTLGPGMRRSTADCAALAADPAAAFRCGGGQIHPGTLTARGVTMLRIVSGLARLMPGVGRLVVDETGLTGLFDIDLTWRPADAVAGPDAAPDLFTALREQWGLKLERATGPIQVLVIDAAAMPAAD